MRWPWRSPKTPSPPENVRVVLTDDSVIGPIPLRYEGVDVDGVHEWVGLVDDSLVETATNVRLGVLPARTSFTLLFLPSDELAEALNRLEKP